MKKIYSKPVAHIEELSLSQQIASCGAGSRGHDNPFGHATSGSASQCAFYMDQFHKVVFTGSNTNCKMKAPSDCDFGGVCYNTVSPGYTIFAS